MENSNTQNYEQGRIAVDPVIFTIKDNKLLVFLNTREKAPFEGLLELPGGLLLSDESAEETLSRKLKDIVGFPDVFFNQFQTFTNPKRDPRTRTISIAFIALLQEEKLADVSHFYDLKQLPQLAFDHNQIVGKAYQYLRENLNHQFTRQFLPKNFTLNQLQMVYEVVMQEKLDNRNFRKKILDSGLVEKVAKLQEKVAHRPATLYQYVSE